MQYLPDFTVLLTDLIMIFYDTCKKFMKIKKIKIDKHASVTINLKLEREVYVTEEMEARRGNVCVVRALEEKKVYDRLELTNGRMAKISRGDIIAGALGARRALQGFVGVIPGDIKNGDILHILNLGGVLGKAVSFNLEYGQPLKVEVLGMVVKNEKLVNIADCAMQLSDHLIAQTPVVAVSGTSMNSGKTEVASKLIQELTWKGYRVCSAKVTGISALKDVLNMMDHGAMKALSFLDFGYPSTVDVKEIPQIAKGAVNQLCSLSPDLLVMELGDGLLGDYGVIDFYRDKEIRNSITCSIICAIDPVGAWGMKKLMEMENIPIHLISGPVTDNIVGIDFINKKLGIDGINAIYQRKELGEFVERMIRGKED